MLRFLVSKRCRNRVVHIRKAGRPRNAGVESPKGHCPCRPGSSGQQGRLLPGPSGVATGRKDDRRTAHFVRFQKHSQELIQKPEPQDVHGDSARSPSVYRRPVHRRRSSRRRDTPCRGAHLPATWSQNSPRTTDAEQEHCDPEARVRHGQEAPAVDGPAPAPDRRTEPPIPTDRLARSPTADRGMTDFRGPRFRSLARLG